MRDRFEIEPCPFFGATTTSDRTGGPIAPWANFTVNCKKNISKSKSKVFHFSFLILPQTTEQKYYLGFSTILSPGVQATVHGSVSANSIMRNSAHFSPRFCASALFFLRMIRGMRKRASVMSKLVITTLSVQEKKIYSSKLVTKTSSPGPILASDPASSWRQIARCPASPRTNVAVSWETYSFTSSRNIRKLKER